MNNLLTELKLRQENLQMRPNCDAWSKAYRWDRIERHMREAKNSLESLYRSVIEKRDCKHCVREMTEGQFSESYAHVYHHLNFAWNTRKMCEHDAESSFELNEKWPLEFERYKREEDDDLPPVITFEPMREPSRIVTFDEMSEKDVQRMVLPIQIGRAENGETICADLAKLPHLIVAGATGQGKTVFLNSVIYRFLTHMTPKEVRLVVADPRCVEYTALIDSPFLAAPVIHETREFVPALKWIDIEMERRLKLFSRAHCRNIQEYNGRFAVGAISEKVPYLVMLVDEMSDYMALAKKQVESLVSRVSAKARAAGIHFIIATQQPDVVCLTNLLKANLPARIAFKMARSVDSRHIIERSGAENLNGRGDLLFSDRGPLQIRRAQCPYVPVDKFSEACDAAIRKYGQAKYLFISAKKKMVIN